jgi:hypothetical protein
VRHGRGQHGADVFVRRLLALSWREEIAGKAELHRRQFPFDRRLRAGHLLDVGGNMERPDSARGEPVFPAPVTELVTGPCVSTWRATSVTVYLENGGRVERAQQMAAHESPRTTKL